MGTGKLTAVAAVAIFVSQRLAFVRAKDLSDVQDHIANIKEAGTKLEQQRIGNELAAAVARAKEADAKIAEAQRGAAEANRKAEAERLARVKIEEKLADRSLSQEQGVHLTAILSTFKGQPINIIEYTLSNEAVMLSRQIQSMLVAAGWDVKVIGALTGAETKQSGVLILTAQGQTEIPAAVALTAALNSERIVSSYSYDGGLFPTPTPSGAITMLVARKPAEARPVGFMTSARSRLERAAAG